MRWCLKCSIQRASLIPQFSRGDILGHPLKWERAEGGGERWGRISCVMAVGGMDAPNVAVSYTDFICSDILKWTRNISLSVQDRLKYSGADSMGHWGTCPPLSQMAGHGGTVSRRTANRKLTKLYWPSRKRSPKRLSVLLGPKCGGARPKKHFFPALCAGLVPPLSNSFRRHCRSKWSVDGNGIKTTEKRIIIDRPMWLHDL